MSFTDFSGPQNFHTWAVPLIDGIGVLVAMAVAGVFDNHAEGRLASLLALHRMRHSALGFLSGIQRRLSG